MRWQSILAKNAQMEESDYFLIEAAHKAGGQWAVLAPDH
jgi:hypothetical protein